MPVWLSRPALIAAIVIVATVPARVDLESMMAVLRAAAIMAGCERPIVSVKMTADTTEIRAECP